MRIKCVLIGMALWMLAVIIDSLGYLLEMPASGAFAGIAILLGIGYFFMAVIGPSDPKLYK